MSTSFKSHLPRPLALAARLLCAASFVAPAWAQDAPAVFITGNPLGREVGNQAASVLAGEGLLLRRASTLGETLDGLPGVATSGFGPNASRPVIRGLDGDRVRLLANGGASIDASNLSFDHAVAIDPLVAERIEVLRGPAALLYGGNATGGVVNSIDNRIPRLPTTGLSGRAELRAGGAAAERSGAVVLEGGGNGLAWHADAYGRQSSDLQVPRFVPLENGQALDPSTRVRNSAARGEGGALGAGWVSERGFLGASVETFRNRYGVTADPEVTIRMQRDRVALAGEWRALPAQLGQFISQVSTQASQTRYAHQEIEGSGAIGTTFKSQGDDLRVELRHARWGGVEGVFGLQTENLDFSALGAEAFVPNTRTHSSAVFVLEEWAVPTIGGLVLSAGGRVERVRVTSAGDAADASDEARFGAASERRFTPKSLSLGARLPLDAAAEKGQGWVFSATFGQTQRAPAYYELFAKGLHVATAAFERGDPSLGVERSRHAELGAAWQQGPNRLNISLYRTQFARFIALDATGQDITVPGADGAPDQSLPEYAFRPVRARLQGFEIDGRWRVFERGLQPGLQAGSQPSFQRTWALDMTVGIDSTTGRDRDSGQALPRLAPTRLRLGLELLHDNVRWGLVLRHAARQNQVPSTDSATASYTLLDLSAAGRLGSGQTSWFLRLRNASNQLGFNASAIQTVRGLAPLPGRALAAGMQWRF